MTNEDKVKLVDSLFVMIDGEGGLESAEESLLLPYAMFEAILEAYTRSKNHD